jgi:hypothetical protein
MDSVERHGWTIGVIAGETLIMESYYDAITDRDVRHM